MELSPHEIESLRRSLAIGNGLPPGEIQRLLETCNALLARDRSQTSRDARLRAELDALRPVVAELRHRLTALTREVAAQPDTTARPPASGRGRSHRGS